jgi:hypothetical protein
MWWKLSVHVTKCMQAASAPNLGDGTDASGGQLTSSVLNIIDYLYGGQDAAAASSQAWQQQQQPLSLEDQPLKSMPVTPAATNAAAAAAAAAQEDSEQQTAPDSQVSADRQAAEEEENLLTQAATAEKNGSELQPDCPYVQEEAGVSTDAEADSTLAADEPALADNSTAKTSSTEGKAMLAAMDGLLAERSRLQQELSGYLQQLGSREDGEGEPLVMLSEEYALLVERLLREGRAQQYRALQGWDGPHRCA